MAAKRKVYSREFKEQAVELLNTSGKPGNQIEAELGSVLGSFTGGDGNCRKKA